MEDFFRPEKVERVDRRARIRWAPIFSGEISLNIG
jgi:hypothetical protein